MCKDNAEQWKDVVGFEGLYEVSTKGRVKNLKTGRILGDRYDSNGYKIVDLKRKNYYIHRLTALAFIPNPDNLPEVDHVDEDKRNNDVSNLRWVTASENVRHSTHKYSCQVKQIDKDGNLIKTWDSLKQIERELGYKSGSISNICKGMRRYVYGFRWEYVNKDSQRVKNRKVIVYKGSEYIGEFPSANKASEALGLGSRNIYYCLSGRFNSTHGYSFRYAE